MFTSERDHGLHLKVKATIPLTTFNASACSE